MKRTLLIALLTVIESVTFSAFACTTAIVGAGASKSGKPMIWKQRDTDDPSNVMVYIHATDTSMAYVGLFNADDPDRKAAYAGQNISGFAIVNNVSYNLASTKYYPENGSTMRRALETCTTVDEFEAMLRNMSPRHCSANFAVLDATGACAYIEAADASVTRYDVPNDGWIVRTNYSFSGSENGAGYARYETAYKLMSKHHGKFEPSFFIDGMGRSFYNDVLGYDASKPGHNKYVYDEDFIARPSSSASVCIDGDQIWAAVGYTPGTMMVPFSVSEGENLPTCIMASEELGGECPSNVLANQLKAKMHPLPRDAAKKYIDFTVFRPIRKIIRKYERKCVELYNDGKAEPAAVDELFEQFREEVSK